MSDHKKAASRIQNQLSVWTLVGPVLVAKGQPSWSWNELDGATKIPTSYRYWNQEVPVKKLRLADPLIDLEKHLGKLVDISSVGVRNQCMAFAKIDLPCEGTITLSYDADWRAVWWIDGKEVYSTREGNGGKVGHVRHRIVAGLAKGKHTIAVRVIGSIRGWKLIVRFENWQTGIIDSLRTDRGASWRDYTRSIVRLEETPTPDGTCAGVSTEIYEEWMARLGVDARWLAVVSTFEGSHFKSKHLPMCKDAKPEYEARLKKWVKVLHQHKMSAMSWYALCLYRPAWEKYHKWRQQYLVADPNIRNTKATCCINSPYGDAVIAFVIEALKKFDLDGFWFDGAAFSPVWDSPQPISCICSNCRRKFKADTGLELPSSYDWSKPEFRRWVQWRYDVFSQYWQRVVDEVHAAVPEATLVFNHYHRERIGWNAGVPLKPFGANFVAGTEADSEPLRGAFYTRLARAYGRPHTEVWMALIGARKAVANGSTTVFNPRESIDFAIACATAGGHSSTSRVDCTIEGPALAQIAAELKPREPYVGLPSIPYIALHVSQQTETFVFGRNPSFITDEWTDYYWNSLTGWHHLLAFSGLTCDVAFDDHITKTWLQTYPYLVMPLAVALRKKQFETVMDYVHNGGTLVTGPWFGLRDEWGETTAGYPLGDRSHFPFGQEFPSWQQIADRTSIQFTAKPDQKSKAQVLDTKPLHNLHSGNAAVSLNYSKSNPVLSVTKIGKGSVVQLAVDLGTLFRYSDSQIVANAFREFFSQIMTARPLVELVDGEGLILGLFTKEKNVTIVHVQQFARPWNEPDLSVQQPVPRQRTELRWNGAKPKSVRCALPQLGDELPVKKAGNSWRITVPSFVWGQVVRIQT